MFDPSNGGTDTVLTTDSFSLPSEVENLFMYDEASATTSTLVGNELANSVKGDAGANVLKGGLGKDQLVGNGGADKFVFDTTPNSSTNWDTISDFEHGIDKINLALSKYAGLKSTGPLSSIKFKVGTSATDADDRIIYNHTNGYLYYDPDSTGSIAKVLFAVLATKPIITASDFVVI